MAWVATRPAALRGGVWLVIAGNALWVAASGALLFRLAPSALGYAFVIAQAAAVAVLAALEYLSLVTASR